MPRLAPCPTCSRHVFTEERRCPHCGDAGTAFAAALALAATFAVACSTADVYGPPARDLSARTSSPTATESATQTATVKPPSAKVYGPPAIDPSLRNPDTAASATTSANATTSASAPKR